MGAVVFLLLLVVAGIAVVAFVKSNKRKALERKEAELQPVRKLAFEDVTALGEELQRLDTDLAGRELDAGAHADYQRALDAYESAKTAADTIAEPEQVRHVTEILEDGRYAMACVRSRVDHEPLPTRRPPCFFDPRHGPSVEDVAYSPPGGTTRDVPACALDAERVRAGAEPDIRQVMVGLAPGALLAGRPRLPAVRRRLLRRVRADELDVHGDDARWRVRRHWATASARSGTVSARASARSATGSADVRRHRRHVRRVRLLSRLSR